MTNLKEFFKLTKKKILLSIILLLVLTPLTSLLWYSYPIWGFYPVIFMGFVESCDRPCGLMATCTAVCSVTFKLFPAWFYSGHKLITILAISIIDLTINFFIAYLISSAIIFGYYRLKKK